MQLNKGTIELLNINVQRLLHTTISSSYLLQVANNIGQYVELKGAPMELMAHLTAPGHAFAVNADTVQALGELRKVFELLNDMGASLASCSAMLCQQA